MTRTIAFIGALAVLMLAACGGSGASHPTPTTTPEPPSNIVIRRNEPVVIGVSAALTGDQTNIGSDISDAVALAIKDFGGTLKLRTVQPSVLDDGCTDSQKAGDVARAFVGTTNLIGVVGPMCTTGAQAANGQYERGRVVHLAPSATRVDLSAQGEGYFFRVAWRDDVQASVQARYAHDTLHADTAVLIDDAEPYGRGLADEFNDAFQDAGGRILSRERIERGTTDFRSLARKLKGADPDVAVFEGLDPEGALLVKALNTEQYQGEFIGPDGLLSVKDFLTEGGTATEGAIITGGPAPDDAFVAKFRDATQRIPTTPFVLQTYDAVMVLLKAVEAVAVEQGDGSLVVDRAQLADKIRSSKVAGLTRSISFDDHGDRTGDSVGEAGLVIYKVTDAKFVPVR